MSKLTLEDAISHCLEVAEQNETQAEKIGRQFIGSAMDKRATDCQECAAEQRQLAEWLTDYKELKNSIGAVKLELLKEAQAELEKRGNMLHDAIAELEEAKRLLKSATGIIKDADCNEDYLCDECEYRAKCDGGFSFYWRYAAEALALIGEEGERNG